MALPSSGPLTLAQIQTEFGGSNPISLSEYYAGGANVPAGTSGTNGAVPSSGTISIANFYGTQKVAPTFYFTISSHIDQANLRSLAVSAGWGQTAPVVATLTAGYYLYSSNTSAPALTIDGSWPGGVTFINNGYVMGMGGQGGGWSSGTYNAGISAGGNAINLGVSCTIQNNSYIGGGGGGGGAVNSNVGLGGGGAGGGAGGYSLGNTGTPPVNYYGGAGGGIGASGSNAPQATNACGGGGGRIMPGSNTTLTSVQATCTCVSTGGGGGNAGSASYSGSPNAFGAMTAGLGGSGGGTGGVYALYYNTASIYVGGGGGGWGASGSNAASNLGVQSGAAGGKCVNLNGYSLTWSATGTRYGAIS